MIVQLHRVASSINGTFGVMTLADIPLCVTCEDPWNNNERGKSCIPEGKYQCKPFSGLKYKNVWEVTNVPGRSAILIHNGNTIRDTEGCILVGKSFSTLEHLPSIRESVTTLNELRQKLPKEFILEIINKE